MVAHFADGIEIPLHPFFGSMALRRRKALAASTAHGVDHGGNLDNKDLVRRNPRSTFPCTPRARFLKSATATPDKATAKWISTALETSLVGTFNYGAKSMPLKWPARGNAQALHHHGLHDDLNMCAQAGGPRDD